jgi:hypothetical protein
VMVRKPPFFLVMVSSPVAMLTVPTEPAPAFLFAFVQWWANAANARRLPGSAWHATSDLIVFYAAPSGYEISRRPARMPHSGEA